MGYRDLFNEWLNLDSETKEELLSIKDEKEIEDRFYKDLEFGTGGLRGIMGAGSNRMNKYTVARASLGLANYFTSKKNNADSNEICKIAIAYDSRNNSELFAKISAVVYANNGFEVYLFDRLVPVPVLSFTTAYLGCDAGVMITASHNPKEYNGYKVYWEDGAQLPPKEADVVAKEMGALDMFTEVKIMYHQEAVDQGLIKIIGPESDEIYLRQIQKMCINPDCIAEVADDFKIIYTPFHGAGYKLVPEILKRIGYKNVICVPEQMVIDGNFPTVKSPNPENKEGFNIAIEMAKQQGVDLIIGTDPDSDRCGTVLKSSTGEYVTLSGNQMGVLLIDYIITAKKLTNTMPPHPAVLKSVVSTEMARKVANENGVECFDTFTGFKFLAEKIKQFEATGSHQYLFAF